MNAIRSFKDLNSGNEFNSFTESYSQTNPTLKNIDKSEIADFLIHGWYYFEGTPLQHIKKEVSYQSSVIDSEKSELKNLNFNELIEDFISKFEDLSNRLNGKKISVDLTGGIDSRLVATLLKHYGVNFDGVFSLISGNNNELSIVKKVSEALNIKLHTINEVEDNIEIEELIHLSEGLADFNSLISLVETLKYRSSEEYDLTITGVGGELYKDFWWQQDFPFYGTKAPNIEKLVHTRMYPCRYPDSLFNEESLKCDRRLNTFISRLGSYSDGKNISTYDKLYYQVRIKEQVSLLSNISNKYGSIFSPLIDPYFVELASNIPANKKWFNKFHREIISRLNKTVARIPTTEGGISVSNQFDDLSRDAWKYLITKSKKAAQRYAKKNSFINSNSTYTEIFEESVIYLKKVGFINTDFKHSTCINNQKLKSRLITVSFLIKKLLSDG